MASKYFRAGVTNWDDDASWSTTSGGSADTTKPTAADDVFLDANSANCTINAAAVCRSINCTGYTGTLTHNNLINLTIGDGTAGASNIALKFVAGMTYTLLSVNTSKIKFISTSATVQTIDFAGKSSGPLTWDGVGGSWQLTGTVNSTSTNTACYLNKGTLDFNGQSFTAWSFRSDTATARTITLGNSTLVLTSTATAGDTAWNTSTTTNLTFTANTATITCNGSNAQFRGGGLTYGGTVSLTGAGAVAMTGANTFANLTRTGTAAKTDSLSLDANITVSGTFTSNGNSATNRMLVQSNTVGTARTITAATVSVTNSDFQDITGAGAGSWDLSAITGLSGDCGGNSGITFTTGAAQTYTGGTDSWSTAAKWTSRVPLPQDDCVMSGVTGGAITADMPRLGKSIDWTGASGTPTWALTTTLPTFYGSLTLISGMTVTGLTSDLQFCGRGTHTITSAGKAMPNSINIIAPGGTYTLQDSMACTTNWTLNNGTFNANNFSLSALLFNSNVSTTRSLIMGTGTWTIQSTASTNVWRFATTTGLTFSGSSATIAITSISANTKSFDGGGLTYGTLTYTVAGSTGKLTLTGSNSFAAINFSDANNARTLEFTAGTTTTIRNANGFNVQGTSGKLMTIQSATASGHTLSSTGLQSCNYLSISRSTAQGGGSWYAGANSTNSGNNTGWIFSAPPSVTGGGIGAPGTRNLQNLQNLMSL